MAACANCGQAGAGSRNLCSKCYQALGDLREDYPPKQSGRPKTNPLTWKGRQKSIEELMDEPGSGEDPGCWEFS